MERISPRALARDKLLEFYHRESESLGRKPDGSEFFPIDLGKLMQSLLPEWQMIERKDLLQNDVYHPLLGRADFAEKKIFVNAGQPNRYTVAHELGHVFLEHGGCHMKRDFGPRSILRPGQLEPSNVNEISREKEANASLLNC